MNQTSEKKLRDLKFSVSMCVYEEDDYVLSEV